MSLEQRQLSILRLPLPKGVRILHPELAILSFGRNLSTVDIGALCYERRSERLGSRSNNGRPMSERLVDPASLVHERISSVRRVINHFEELLRNGKALASVAATARYFASFHDWAESSRQPDFLAQLDFVKEAFAAYVVRLTEQRNLGQLSQNTAAITQNEVLAVLSALTDKYDLHVGVNLLRSKKGSGNPTEPPPEDAQSRVLALCDCLFDGLQDLCVNFRPYPFALNVPPHLNASSNVLWAFPTQPWCMAPHLLAIRDTLKVGNWAYGYETGTLAKREDISGNYVYSPKKMPLGALGQFAVDRARQQIDEANADAHHFRRLHLSNIAAGAFLLLFLANTGMNLDVVLTLPWGDKYEVGAERQGYRTIKYRASARIVAFEIQAVFLPAFKKYLKLRAHILGEKKSQFLFCASHRSKRLGERYGTGILKDTYRSLRSLDPALPKIMSRSWRAGKSDWLIRKTDISTTALILQNSEEVVRRSYTAGSQTTQNEEMGEFLSSLHNKVVQQRGATSSSIMDTAVGGCAAHGSPQKDSPGPAEPDCKSPEGCLFCGKYRVHADSTDMRKLLSCRYCIERTLHLVESEEEVRTLITPIFDRINHHVSEIEKSAPGLTVRIQQEVNEGELDGFWAAKLEMLMELEIAS